MIIFTLVGSMDPADKRSLYVPVATGLDKMRKGDLASVKNKVTMLSIKWVSWAIQINMRGSKEI
ncbi:LOW QUALITY PROTEIN: hypothetical protein YC2023_038522 [Brassica napus]